MKKLFVFLCSLLMASSLQAQQHSDLPDLTLKDLEGRDVTVSELPNGAKAVVVVFWAAWCRTACVSVLDMLNDKVPEWNAEQVRMYAVAMDDERSSSEVKPMVESKGWDFPVLLDVEGALKRALNVTSPPRVILFDGNGQAVFQCGYADDVVQQVTEAILQLQ